MEVVALVGGNDHRRWVLVINGCGGIDNGW